jgi:hypothetical protein
MRAWVLSDLCGRLLVALVLTVPGPFGSIAGGFGGIAQAQEVKPRPGEPGPRTDRLVHGLEPKRVQTVRIRPDGQALQPTDGLPGLLWKPRATDFWMPGELGR